MKQCSIHVSHPEALDLFFVMRSINGCFTLARLALDLLEKSHDRR